MRYAGFLSIPGLLAVAACMTGAPEADHLGKSVYMDLCVGCHGPSAMGDGRIAGELPVPPADLTILAAGNDGIFPASRVMEKIYGYPGRYQTDVMPEFGPILEGPTVLWTDETGQTIETPQALIDLVDYLGTLQQG